MSSAPVMTASLQPVRAAAIAALSPSKYTSVCFTVLRGACTDGQVLSRSTRSRRRTVGDVYPARSLEKTAWGSPGGGAQRLPGLGSTQPEAALSRSPQSCVSRRRTRAYRLERESRPDSKRRHQREKEGIWCFLRQVTRESCYARRTGLVRSEPSRVCKTAGEPSDC